jgi:RND family efflux transporter MFP subunit
MTGSVDLQFKGVNLKISSASRLTCAVGASITLGFAPSVYGAEFDCVIEPRQVVELRSPMEGLIERINVERGDYVRKGQELAYLDAGVDHAQAAISALRSQMQGAVGAWESRGTLSAKKYARMDELHKENLMSAQLRDEAAAEKQIADSELQDAVDNRKLAGLEHKRQLEIIRLKTIRSPISGVVVERFQNPGELAEAGVGRKPILKLAEVDILNVEVLLPAAAYGKVKLGAVVSVVSDIPAGSKHRAIVKVIDPVLDAASGTFGLRLELANSQRKIPGGSRCRVDFPDIAETASTRARKSAAAQR